MLYIVIYIVVICISKSASFKSSISARLGKTISLLLYNRYILVTTPFFEKFLNFYIWPSSSFYNSPRFFANHPGCNVIFLIRLEVVLTLIGKFLGHFWDRFTGKLIQSSVWEFWGVTQAVLLENSSKRKHLVENNISRILGCHTGHFTGKLIQTKCYISYMVSVKKFEWMSFPVKRPVWRPGK